MWDRVSDPVSRPKAEGSMQPKYEYRRRLPHYQKDNHPLFVTFTTSRRWGFPPEARTIVLNCCLEQHTKKFNLHAAVVMPDHVHVIYSALRRQDGWEFTLPEIMKAIKGKSARLINLALNRRGSVWQEEFFDHVLRSNDRVVDRVEYVCQNPVRAGLTAIESGYRWIWKGQIPVL